MFADGAVLGDRGDESGDGRAEAPPDVGDGVVGVLDDVVQQTGDLDGLGAAGVAQDARDGTRVGGALADLDADVAIGVVELGVGA